MKFVTLFPEVENVHLIKSCGMIPFILFKYYSYDSTIVGYNNDKYDYLNNEVKGLKIKFLKKVFNNKILDSCIFIAQNYREIDILHLYHMTPRSFICALFYKTLRRNGIVYLKADNTNLDVFRRSRIKLKLKLSAIRIFDIISSESHIACQYFNENYPVHYDYIPNGFYDNGIKADISSKENIILTVARIGEIEKANDIMLEGFAKASKSIPGWKLRVIGPVNNKFKPFLKDYFNKYPDLKDKVEIVGPIKDRTILDVEYKRAKIFTLTSISEGFPTVFLEAVKSGCYIITSNIEAANEITRSGELGTIFKMGNSDEYAKALIDVCADNQNLNKISYKIRDFAYNNYYWPATCLKLNNLILNMQKKKSASNKVL